MKVFFFFLSFKGTSRVAFFNFILRPNTSSGMNATALHQRIVIMMIKELME